MSRAGPPRCLLRLPPRKAELGRVCRALFLRYGHTDRWAHPDRQTTDKCNGHVHASSRAPPTPARCWGLPPPRGPPAALTLPGDTGAGGGGGHTGSALGTWEGGRGGSVRTQPCSPPSPAPPSPVPPPQLSRATGWGHSASIWGLPNNLGKPPVLRGGPAPMAQHRAPLQHTRGGGQHAVPPRQAPSSTTPTGPDPSTARNGVGTDPTLPVGVLGGGGGGHMQGRRSPEATTACRVPGAICPS